MSLERLQQEFAAHIRDPEQNPVPSGVEDRRMKIYRDLFFNNIRSLLAANFPVLHTLHGEHDWNGLIRDFYASHRCHTPLFPEVAREFLRYLQDERGEREGDPPYLLELAHYEWVEMALELDIRSTDDPSVDPAGDPLEGIPVLSPLVHVLSYRFPVHRISPDFQPDTAPEMATHLLVWRNRNDDVKFMQINEFSRLLLEFMGSENTLSGRKLLEQVAKTTGHSKPEKVVTSGAELLDSLKKREVVLGTRIQTDV
jgi:hypothetical protein